MYIKPNHNSSTVEYWQRINSVIGNSADKLRMLKSAAYSAAE